MKPSELFALTPESISYDPHHLHDELCPELAGESFKDIVEEQRYVKICTYKYISFDGYRMWELAGVFFKDTPVMITQTAGRGGRDHIARFVVNRAAYFDMVAYLNEHKECYGFEYREFFGIDEDIPLLNSFYGTTWTPDE